MGYYKGKRNYSFRYKAFFWSLNSKADNKIVPTIDNTPSKDNVKKT